MKFNTVHGHGGVWVEVDGEKVDEMMGQRIRKGQLVTNTAFIQAQTGKTFKVYYAFPSFSSLPSPTEIQLYIDGELVDTDVSGCDSIRSQVAGSFEGYSVEDNVHTSTYKAFQFAKPKLTDALLGDEEIDFPDEACSIRVVIGWRRIKGQITHSRFQKRRYEETSAKKVHDETKTAALGVHTIPGNIVHTKSTYTCHCNFIKPKDTEEYEFIFRYCTRGWLEWNKLIEPELEDDDDPEIVLDQYKTYKAAHHMANRRARLPMSVSPSQVEIKKEIKIEPCNSQSSFLSSFSSLPTSLPIPPSSQSSLQSQVEEGSVRHQKKRITIDLTQDD